MPTFARLVLISACILWAFSYIAAKVALADAPPLTIAFLRLVIASVLYALWLIVNPRKGTLGGTSDLFTLAVLSLVGTTLHFGLQIAGLVYTTASHAAIFTVTGPISIAILAALFLREKLSLLKIGGIAVAIGGVICVLGIESVVDFSTQSHVFGDVLVLLSIVCWGIFTVFGKNLTDRIGAARFAALTTIAGTIWTAPVAWIEVKQTGFSLTQISPAGWGAIAFLGIACSFLATFFYFIALEESESQKVGVYLYCIPPMTALIAYLTLGEQLSISFWIGSLLVLGGVAMTERG